MKKIVLASNPYRDRNFKYAQAAKNCLQEAASRRGSACPLR